MSTTEEIHSKVSALIYQGDYIEACLYETAAAFGIEPLTENEPTRSMLFIGAASLALKARRLDLARYIASNGLKGKPSAFHSRELSSLLFQANNPIHVTGGARIHQMQGDDLS